MGNLVRQPCDPGPVWSRWTPFTVPMGNTSPSLGFCFPISEMEIGKPFPVSSLSSTKRRLEGMDKLTSCPGHRLCCQNMVSPQLWPVLGI